MDIDLDDFFVTGLIISIPLAIVFSVFVCLYFSLNEDSYNSCTEVTGRETKAVTLNCYVKHNDQWYSKDEYKHVRLDK